jgi:hypothetical protein
MKKDLQDVTVVKLIYSTTHKDYAPTTFEIEVDDRSITGITEDSAKYIYKELGKFLFQWEGGRA